MGRASAAFAAVGVAALGLGVPAAPAQAPASSIRAGVAVVDATWHVGASAGQYAGDVTAGTALTDPNLHATRRAPSYGVQSRLTIRALVVEGSDGERVALVKSDNYLAQDLLLRRAAQLAAEAGSTIDADHILHTVTHNHSSPYYATPAWGVWLFQDVVDLRMFEYQARAMAAAITKAEANLRPARMGATTVTYATQHRNAPGPAIADDGTPVGYPRYFNDLGLVVMRFDDVTDPGRPRPLATWMNFGVHPESLDGYDLISADYIGPLERFVGRETGAPLVFSQGGVGSSEPANDTSVRLDNGVVHAFSHQGYAQAERSARMMADAVIAGWREIGAGGGQVPWTADFPVDVYDAWLPGPVSHPYPSVSNCRSEPTVEGDPGVPILGLPDCERAGTGAPLDPLADSLKAHGIPVPDHYAGPGFTAVEENLRLHLQAFRLGEVLLASCVCEAQVDLVLNLESRLDRVPGNIWNGFDWSTACDDLGDGTWACADPGADDLADRSLVVSDAAYRRMAAEVNNPADGWDAPANAVAASSEPADPAAIWGNFTHEELPAHLGYTLPVGIGHGGDYNGYTVSYREYMSRDHYRKALTSYGPHTADYMATRLVRMAGALKGGPPLAPEPLAALAAADEARQAALAAVLGAASAAAFDGWEATLPDDTGPAAVLAQPVPVTRFAAATFTWRGGSNAVDNPVAIVERQGAGGTWTPYGDQSGEVQTVLELPESVVGLATTRTGRQEWRWTANFEAFDAFPATLDPRGPQVPDGVYRFSVEGRIRAGGTTAPYRLVSEPFTVGPWEGIQVSDLRAEPDGSASFVVAPIAYPRSYPSTIGFVGDDGGSPICKTCTFRPWAETGQVARAAVTVVRGDGSTRTVDATLEGDRWVARHVLGAGDSAVVARGGVVDTFGEINGTASNVVGDAARVASAALADGPAALPAVAPALPAAVRGVPASASAPPPASLVSTAAGLVLAVVVALAAATRPARSRAR